MSTNQIQLVCPNCETHTLFSAQSGQSQSNVVCGKCKKTFIAWIVRIRAKNSRQDKRANTRAYSVRVIDVNGGQHLIEFQQKGIADFELRAGDHAVFSYVNNKLLMVQNLTVGRYLNLKSGCSVLTLIICGILLLLLISVCALAGLLRTHL
jgi:hypothetical protein